MISLPSDFSSAAAPAALLPLLFLLCSLPLGALGDALPVHYQLLTRTGQRYPEGSANSLVGQLFTIDGAPIPEELLLKTPSPKLPPNAGGAPAFAGGSAPPAYNQTADPAVSDYPDYISLLPVAGHIYAFNHFETRPGELGFFKLEQAPDGNLSIATAGRVDWADWGGLWNPCAGSVSPWTTHIGSEEYEPDARALSEATSLADPYDNSSLWLLNPDTYTSVVPFMRYFGIGRDELTLGNVSDLFNPYLYGYAFEAEALPDGTYSASKLYTLGRLSHELSLVMPDNRTVYSTDDGTSVGFFRYVADEAGDLSAGTLYAAKARQTGSTDGGQFEITWLELGHATQDEVEALAQNTTFSSIFLTSKPKPDGSCSSGFTAMNTNSNIGKQECLKLQPGMAQAAAFLETRRFAALLGATTEWTKWEGITYNPSRRQLYTSMSEVKYGMEDGAVFGRTSSKYDIGTTNSIRVQYNPCGCVYRLTLDSDFVADSMESMLCGRLVQGLGTINDPHNICELDGLANPDNLSFLDEDTLVIGEDSEEGHRNDVVWQMDLRTGDLTRILSTPYGAESTAVYAYPNLGGSGFGYITATVQHPYVESDSDKINDPASTGRRAYIGYLGPIPSGVLGSGRGVRFEGIFPADGDAQHQVLSTTELDTASTQDGLPPSREEVGMPLGGEALAGQASAGK